MSPIAFAMDGLLALLLLAALSVGLKLEKRLRGLRDSQASFAKAALELNAAIARAETGLSEIRTAVQDADHTLMERVDEARAAARKLEQAVARAPTVPAAAEPAIAPAPVLHAPAAAPAKAAADDAAALPIKDLLARLRSALPAENRAAEVLNLRERAAQAAKAPALLSEPSRSRARVDDDLFAEPDAFPTLRTAGLAR